MADAVNEANVDGKVVTASAEDVQNQENENNENTLLEGEGGTKMEVDGIDESTAAVESSVPALPSGTVTDVTESNPENEESKTDVDASPTDVALSRESQAKDIEVVKEIQVIDLKDDEAEKGISVNNGKPSTVEFQANSTSVEVAKPDTDTPQKTNTVDGDGDSYMVLEEADGDDDNESEVSSDNEELTENEQLRKANVQLSERLAVLEEFIELEFSERFGRYMKKRAHLIDVMGLGQKTADIKVNGKRSSKSLELVGLLKIVKDQARSNGTNRSPRKYNNNRDNSNRGNATSATQSAASASRKEQPTANAEGTGKGVNIKKEVPEPDAKVAKPKRCLRCRSTDHLVRDCPVPIDVRDRRVILRKDKKRDSRLAKKEKDLLEAIRSPKIKAMSNRRRRITREAIREQQGRTRQSR